MQCNEFRSDGSESCFQKWIRNVLPGFRSEAGFEPTVPAWVV